MSIQKVKCDQEFPQCGKCKARGVECIGVDPVTGREIPRSYIIHLEERVKQLESQLKQQSYGSSGRGMAVIVVVPKQTITFLFH